MHPSFASQWVVFNSSSEIKAITHRFPGLQVLTSDLYYGCIIQWKPHSQWFPSIGQNKMFRSYNYPPLFPSSWSCHIAPWPYISLPTELHHHLAPPSPLNIGFKYYLLQEAPCDPSSLKSVLIFFQDQISHSLQSLMIPLSGMAKNCRHTCFSVPQQSD